MDALKRQLSKLSTESINNDFGKIDVSTTLEVAQLMNAQDATVPQAIERNLPKIVEAIDAIVEKLKTGGRLIYAGAGTAGRLGVLDASECPPTFNTPPELVVGLIAGGDFALRNAIEGAEDDADAAERDLKNIHLSHDDVVVGISASGRTPYAVRAVQFARQNGCTTIGLSCNEGSELGKNSQFPIEIVVGPELVAGSTRLKAGTCQKLVLNMLTTISMVRMGKTYGNLMVDLKATNEKLRARSWNLVKEATGASDEEVDVAMESFGGKVKPAILSLLTGAMHVEVLEALDAAGGRLRDAVTIINSKPGPKSP